MKPSLSNIWPTVLGLSRTTVSTILHTHDSDRVVEELAVRGVLKPESARALIRAQSRFANGFEDCVTLAFCVDYLAAIWHPAAGFMINGGSWQTLNLSPLMPFLKPTARYLSSTKNSDYHSTANLTTRLVPDFFDIFLADTDLFGGKCESTNGMSLSLCPYAAILLKDRALLETHRGVITLLIRKSASLAGTQRESQEFLELIERILDQKYGHFFDYMKATPSAFPVPSPVPAVSATADSDESLAALLLPPEDSEEPLTALLLPPDEQPDHVLKEVITELDGLLTVTKVM